METYKMNLEIAPVKKSDSVMKRISSAFFPFKSKTETVAEKDKSFGEIFDEQLKKLDSNKYVNNRYQDTLIPEIKLHESMMNFARRTNVIVSFDLKREKRDK